MGRVIRPFCIDKCAISAIGMNVLNVERATYSGFDHTLNTGDKMLVASLSKVDSYLLSKGFNLGSTYSRKIKESVQHLISTNYFCTPSDIHNQYKRFNKKTLSIIGSDKTIIERIYAVDELLSGSEMMDFIEAQAFIRINESSIKAVNEDGQFEGEEVLSTTGKFKISLQRLLNHLNEACSGLEVLCERRCKMLENKNSQEMFLDDFGTIEQIEEHVMNILSLDFDLIKKYSF